MIACFNTTKAEAYVGTQLYDYGWPRPKEWVLLISFPDHIGGNPSVVNFSGARNDALAEAKKRIDNWLRRLEKKKRAPVSSRPNHDND